MKEKRKITILKVFVDIAMIVLILPTEAYNITDYKIHEWLGVLLFIFFILHHVLNRNWYRTLFRGKYTVIRTLHTVINLLLMAAMLIVLVTGIIDSYVVFSFISINIHAGRIVSKLHLLAAIWVFLLISVHLGFHWGSVVALAGSGSPGGSVRSLQALRASRTSPAFRLAAARLAVFLLSGYGIYAFIAHKLGQKLFLLARFTGLDFTEPAIFFFADYLAVMCLFASIAYYSIKLIQHSCRDSIQ